MYTIPLIGILRREGQCLGGAVAADQDGRGTLGAFQQHSIFHREALTRILDVDFKREGSDYWIEKFSATLPIAPVHDLAQALDNPFVRQTGMIREVPHPLRPDLKVLASPIKINGERPAQRAAPLAGADNALLKA